MGSPVKDDLIIKTVIMREISAVMLHGTHPISNCSRQTCTVLLLAGLAVALVAISVDMAAVAYLNPGPIAGDGAQFLSLAQSLEAGRGYHLEIGVWPNEPNLGRTPLWPVLLSVPLHLFPNGNANFVARCVGTVLHGLSAFLLVILVYQLTADAKASFIAGLLLAAYAPVSGLLIGGYSEVPYVATMAFSLVLFFEGGLLTYAGALVGGAAVLARPNYIVLPILLLLLVVAFRPRILIQRRRLVFALVATSLFWLLPALWILRNYRVSGCFPILSATEGETFYGGNNSRVESEPNLWGYWVDPDEIPGERSKRELSHEKTEAQVDAYYHEKGVRFIREHLSALPLLVVGKVYRGFVPIAWSPSNQPFMAKLLIAFFRCCLYLAFLVLFWFWQPKSPMFHAIVASMFLATLLTTIIYYGCFRLTFCLEPFLIPFVAVGALRFLRSRTLHGSPRLARSQNLHDRSHMVVSVRCVFPVEL